MNIKFLSLLQATDKQRTVELKSSTLERMLKQEQQFYKVHGDSIWLGHVKVESVYSVICN